jgi:P2-related tail formation protein
VFATLECFPAYLDPALAPADFVTWLGTWVAVDTAPCRAGAHRRRLVARAVELHRHRGTRAGLLAHLRVLVESMTTDPEFEVDVADSGGATASTTAGAPIRISDTPRVTVRVSTLDPTELDTDTLRTAVAGLVPAHVTATIETMTREPRTG